MNRRASGRVEGAADRRTRMSRPFRHRRRLWLRDTRRSSSRPTREPERTPGRLPYPVIPVRSKVTPGPEPVQPTTPTTRSVDPIENTSERAVSSGSCNDAAIRPSPSAFISTRPGLRPRCDPSPMTHTPVNDRGEPPITDASSVASRGSPATTRFQPDQPCVASDGSRSERLSVGTRRRVQRVPHRRELAPERADDRRYVGSGRRPPPSPIRSPEPDRLGCRGRRPPGPRTDRRGRPPR